MPEICFTGNEKNQKVFSTVIIVNSYTLAVQMELLYGIKKKLREGHWQNQ